MEHGARLSTIMFPIRVSGSGLNRTDTRIILWNTVPV